MKSVRIGGGSLAQAVSRLTRIKWEPRRVAEVTHGHSGTLVLHHRLVWATKLIARAPIAARFEGARAADPLSLAPLLRGAQLEQTDTVDTRSNATNLRHLVGRPSFATQLASKDLSYSEFGDSEAQPGTRHRRNDMKAHRNDPKRVQVRLWAAAKVGPLPLQCLGFRPPAGRVPLLF